MFHNLQYCVYITQYDGDKMPPVYIGSSSVSKVMNGYRGSVSSKRYKDVWDQELSTNPHLFRTKIIFRCASRKYALWKENRILKRLDAVKNSSMINQSYANINGYCGRDVSGANNPRYGVILSKEQKEKMSKSLLITNSLQTTKNNRSKAQKKAQTRPEVSRKKSIKQIDNWNNNPERFQNSKKSWFTKKHIHLMDVSFLSKKDFVSYCKDNNIPRIKDTINYEEWNIQDLYTYKEVMNICPRGSLISLLNKCDNTQEYSKVLDIINKINMSNNYLKKRFYK